MCGVKLPIDTYYKILGKTDTKPNTPLTNNILTIKTNIFNFKFTAVN